MPEYLKRGKPEADRADDDAKVRAHRRGDPRPTSRRAATPRCASSRAKFDNWSPRALPPVAGRDRGASCAEVAPRDLDDIRFAQAQVRNFAEHQRAAMRDIEVETLPGVMLGHRNIPVETRRLLRARRQVSRCSPRRT